MENLDELELKYERDLEKFEEDSKAEETAIIDKLEKLIEYLRNKPVEKEEHQRIFKFVKGSTSYKIVYTSTILTINFRDKEPYSTSYKIDLDIVNNPYKDLSIKLYQVLINSSTRTEDLRIKNLNLEKRKEEGNSFGKFLKLF